MKCPRFRHFARINHDGTIGICGHMVNGKKYNTYEDLEKSTWIEHLENTMQNNQWPNECVRCQRTEQIGGKSVRQASIDRDNILKPIISDYLIVGGILDNVCNSACQTCDSSLSTKIGSLESKNYKKINHYEQFSLLPQQRILEVDVSGGEPTASKNYKKLLRNLPKHTKIVRMNTNGSRMIDEIESMLQQDITVIVTVSLDGIGDVHDYVRWPIKWDTVRHTVNSYISLQKEYKLLYLDTWTTVSCLNIRDLPNIQKYVNEKKIKHNWAFLETPEVLSVRHKNRFTEPAKHLFPEQVAVTDDNTEALNKFIAGQDQLRGIDIKDYLNF